MTYDKCKGGGIKRDSRSESFAVAVVQFVYPETEKNIFLRQTEQFISLTIRRN
jgi:hypothetical protein